MSNERLESLRDEIDSIDLQLLKLFNQRAKCTHDIADVKRSLDSDATTVYYRPEREIQLLKNLINKNEGPLTVEHVEKLFREILSCCLSLQHPLNIAYLGPPGTYTQAATMKQFGHFAKTRALTSIADVFREVAAEVCHYGVIPVENSTEGVVNHTLDCFMDSDLKICGEVSLPIHHSFMVPEPVSESDVEVIYSHEQSFAQCRHWLDTHMQGIERVAVLSNAEAAKRAHDASNAAAIAGDLAAEQYQMKVLHSNIEDIADNTTRFLVIGNQEVAPSGHDKTSILVATQNTPGALFRVLEPFQERSISLTRIESRPSKVGVWTYVFFIDFDGHQTEDEITQVLSEVQEVAVSVRMLGSYPKSI